ncbi:MAG: hypothetical protein NUW22_12635 [Acidobacteria bacterium]|nr:hypothetical protein [Acidobacteriota bacterium]
MSSNVAFANQAPGSVGYQRDHPCAEHQAVLEAADGRVSLSRRKIAICGFASSSRSLIPVDDPAWSIWTLNQLYRHLPRADRHFDIHVNWHEDNVEGTDHPRWLAECGIPVVMTEIPAGLPTAVRYPIERMIQKFGIDYSTSTVSAMLMMAIDEIDRAVDARLGELPATYPTNGHAVTSAADIAALTKSLYQDYTIGIFGIDLIVGTEYDFQKSCVEFYLGQADARGIRIVIPPQSALLKQRWRYGWQREPDGGLLRLSDYQARHADLVARLGKLQEAHARLIAEMQTLDGAKQEIEHHLNVIDLRSKGGQVPLSAG